MMSVTVVPGLTSTIDELIARQDKIKQDNIMFTFVYLLYKNSRILPFSMFSSQIQVSDIIYLHILQ